jgi:hypothetical protein
MSGTDGLLWMYVALAFLAGLALLFSAWPRWARALLVLSVGGLWFAAVAVLDDVWGWPSSSALPERFVLLAAVIEEPGKTSEGAVYVWVNALEGNQPAAQPRAHRLPYSKDLHALVNDGLKKVRQGITQMGTAEPKRGTRGLSWLRPGSEEMNVKIRDLPSPQLPEK